MAIYRPPRSRWRPRLLVLVVGLVVAGLLIFLTRQDENDPARRRQEARLALTEAVGLLEIFQIEYAEAVERGDVVAATEFDGARSALRRSWARYRSARTVITGEGVGVIDRRYRQLTRLSERHVDEAVIAGRVGQLSVLLETTASRL